MKSRIAAQIACGFLIVGTATGQTVSPDHDREAIASLIEDVEAANNSGDVERWVSLFAPDFVYIAPGAPAVTAIEALTEVARAGFQHDAAIDIEPLEIQVHGDWAFARTRVSGSVTLHESGRVVQVAARQLVIYRKLDSGWRIARLISNSSAQ